MKNIKILLTIGSITILITSSSYWIYSNLEIPNKQNNYIQKTWWILIKQNRQLSRNIWEQNKKISKNIWKQNKNQKNNIKSMIKTIEKQALSSYETEKLMNQYFEKILSYDLYNYFYEKYNIKVFESITNSKYQHIQAIESIFNKYNIEIPINYWVSQDKFETLKLEWEKWIKQALEISFKIEMMEIDNTLEIIKNIDNNDIKVVFSYISWTSYNHLESFLQAIEKKWFVSDLDYSNYINEDEIYFEWWTLKYESY